MRYTFDNNYFNDLYQGIPIGGYTKIIDKSCLGNSHSIVVTPLSELITFGLLDLIFFIPKVSSFNNILINLNTLIN